MNLREIERVALHLSAEGEAALVQKLLLSLDSPSEREIAEGWLVEADRRACELDESLVQPVAVEEVRRKAMFLLR